MQCGCISMPTYLPLHIKSLPHLRWQAVKYAERMLKKASSLPSRSNITIPHPPPSALLRSPGISCQCPLFSCEQKLFFHFVFVARKDSSPQKIKLCFLPLLLQTRPLKLGSVFNYAVVSEGYKFWWHLRRTWLLQNPPPSHSPLCAIWALLDLLPALHSHCCGWKSSETEIKRKDLIFHFPVPCASRAEVAV